jgi:hypothetical protein
MTKQWFVFKDGGQYGPITADELKRKAASRELLPEDLVRPEDQQNWYKASAVKGLFTSDVGESSPQTVPPPPPTVPKTRTDAEIEELVMETVPPPSSPSTEIVPFQDHEEFAVWTSYGEASGKASFAPVSPSKQPSKGGIIVVDIIVGIFVFVALVAMVAADPRCSIPEAVRIVSVVGACIGLGVAFIALVMTANSQQPTDENAIARQREQTAIVQWGAKNPALVCPHCQRTGNVRRTPITQKKGISGAKATGALLTGGLSVLATGLSRKEINTQAHCDNCGSTWIF